MLHTTATLHHETESELTDVLAPTYSTKGFPFLFNHVLDIGLTRSYAFPSVLDLGKIKFKRTGFLVYFELGFYCLYSL